MIHLSVSHPFPPSLIAFLPRPGNQSGLSGDRQFRPSTDGYILFTLFFLLLSFSFLSLSIKDLKALKGPETGTVALLTETLCPVSPKSHTHKFSPTFICFCQVTVIAAHMHET